MVKRMIKALKKGIPLVFAVAALAFVIGAPASALAADQGWYDPHGWFSSGGNLPNESDWYNAMYGGRPSGQPYGYYENQTYGYYDNQAGNTGRTWDQSEPGDLSLLQREQPYAPPATPNYYGNFPTQPGFSKMRPNDYYYEDQTTSWSGPATQEYYGNYPTQPGFSKSNEPSGYYYQDQGTSWRGPATQEYYGNYPVQPGFSKSNPDQERPGSLTQLYREEPFAPPATPNYYGNFPTEPGFSKLTPVEGGQPYAYYGSQTTQEWYGPAGMYHYYTPEYFSVAQAGAGAVYQEQYGPPSTHYYYGNNPSESGASTSSSDMTTERHTYYGTRTYQDQERPGSLTELYREEPNAPPATPNYYGAFPTEPGFSKLQEASPQDWGAAPKLY